MGCGCVTPPCSMPPSSGSIASLYRLCHEERMTSCRIEGVGLKAKACIGVSCNRISLQYFQCEFAAVTLFRLRFDGCQEMMGETSTPKIGQDHKVVNVDQFLAGKG